MGGSEPEQLFWDCTNATQYPSPLQVMFASRHNGLEPLPVSLSIAFWPSNAQTGLSWEDFTSVALFLSMLNYCGGNALEMPSHLLAFFHLVLLASARLSSGTLALILTARQ